MLVTPTNGFESRQAAWRTPVQSEKKAGLRDIMEQASAGRVSNLTQAMRSVSMGSKANAKLSQKERQTTTATRERWGAQSPGFRANGTYTQGLIAVASYFKNSQGQFLPDCPSATRKRQTGTCGSSQ